MAAFRILKSHEGFVRPLIAFASVEDRRPASMQTLSKSREAYNILFECGDLDLSNYFISRIPPVMPHEIEMFWKGLCKVVEALRRLHEVSQDLDTEIEGTTEIIGCVNSRPCLLVFSWPTTNV